VSLAKEMPAEWSRWWVWMWAAIAVTLLAGAFVVSFRMWAWAVALGFGIPEAIGVWTRGDRYPPLTFVTAHYLPRWLTATLIGFFTGSIGGTWFAFPRPWSLGALFGLAFWAIDHFTVTYDSKDSSGAPR